MKTLENWIVNLLAMPIEAINQKYHSDQDVKKDLELLSLPTSERGYTHAGSEVSQEILFRLHAKLKRQRCENGIWIAVIWYLLTPLPLKLAHDLIDRNIAVTDMVYSPQLDEIMWRLATFDEDALYALVSERYTNAKYSASHFKNMLQQYILKDEYLLTVLAERSPSSSSKKAIFEKAVKAQKQRDKHDVMQEKLNRYTALTLTCINWERYEENVLATLQKAIDKYCKRYANSEDNKVYQVAICANAQGAETSINFETKTNSQRHRNEEIQFLSKNKLHEMADKFASRKYNVNPADFLYPDFQTKVHRELDTLTELDYTNAATSTAVDARLETSLLRVAKQIIDEKMLDKLPREETIFLGVSSPRDWYDHVTEVT